MSYWPIQYFGSTSEIIHLTTDIVGAGGHNDPEYSLTDDNNIQQVMMGHIAFATTTETLDFKLIKVSDDITTATPRFRIVGIHISDAGVGSLVVGTGDDGVTPFFTAGNIQLNVRSGKLQIFNNHGTESAEYTIWYTASH